MNSFELEVYVNEFHESEDEVDKALAMLGYNLGDVSTLPKLTLIKLTVLPQDFELTSRRYRIAYRVHT